MMACFCTVILRWQMTWRIRIKVHRMGLISRWWLMRSGNSGRKFNVSPQLRSWVVKACSVVMTGWVWAKWSEIMNRRNWKSLGETHTLAEPLHLEKTCEPVQREHCGKGWGSYQVIGCVRLKWVRSAKTKSMDPCVQSLLADMWISSQQISQP